MSKHFSSNDMIHCFYCLETNQLTNRLILFLLLLDGVVHIPIKSDNNLTCNQVKRTSSIMFDYQTDVKSCSYLIKYFIKKNIYFIFRWKRICFFMPSVVCWLYHRYLLLIKSYYYCDNIRVQLSLKLD